MTGKVREIILDTETTGLYAKNGDRIIEIGCIELIDQERTGRYFHRYINPKRSISLEASKVHGITDSHVADKPTFAEIVKDFIEFVHIDSKLVIHNAGFDMSFINMELELCGYPAICSKRVVDTLTIARRQFPGSPASLDALCKRFKISLSTREKHGALIDAELLAAVYVNLIGTRVQSAMNLFETPAANINQNAIKTIKQRPTRTHEISAEEQAAHEEFLQKLNSPIWKNCGKA